MLKEMKNLYVKFASKLLPTKELINSLDPKDVNNLLLTSINTVTSETSTEDEIDNSLTGIYLLMSLLETRNIIYYDEEGKELDSFNSYMITNKLLDEIRNVFFHGNVNCEFTQLMLFKDRILNNTVKIKIEGYDMDALM